MSQFKSFVEKDHMVSEAITMTHDNFQVNCPTEMKRNDFAQIWSDLIKFGDRSEPFLVGNNLAI